MRFWLPSRIEQPGKPAYTTDNQERISYAINEGARVTPGRMHFKRLNLTIKSEYETKDRNLILKLMKAGGQLRFNKMDAINEGILTPDDFAQAGIPLPKEVGNAPVKEPEKKIEEVVLPDFDTLSKKNLVEWADAQEPPIHLDRRKRKGDLVKEVKEALEERK